MYKKIISAVSAVIVSAVIAVNCTAYRSDNRVSALDLGGIIEDEINKSKTIVLTRGNMMNLVIKDSNGNELTNYYANLYNSAGQNAGIFFSTNHPYYFEEENTLGITNDIEWKVKMKTFGDLVAPNKPLLACGYDTSPSPGVSISHNIYKKYNENDEVVLSCNYDSAQCQEMKILSTNSGETTAFSIPASKAGIFVDKKWASRDGEGFYYIGDTSKKYYADKDMIGKLKTISPASIEDFYVGVDDILNYDLRLDIIPEYQSQKTEYVKWTMNLSDIFKGTDYPTFNSDGTFKWNDKTFDFSQDKKYTSCVLTIVSGACLTVAMPDSSGNVEFYVEKEGRMFDAEINLCYKNSKNDTQKYGVIKNTWLYGGTEHTIFIGVPNVPSIGETVFQMPSGKYSLEFIKVPDGYINPGTVSINIDETANMQQKIITLKSTSTVTLGDVDGNLSIDAADASSILAAYAREATGNSTGYSKEQRDAADVNKDYKIDAVDASLVLAYYSYTATGGKASIKEYIASK